MQFEIAHTAAISICSYAHIYSAKAHTEPSDTEIAIIFSNTFNYA